MGHCNQNRYFVEKRHRQRQRKALERAEWKQEHGNEVDITARQWKGQRMQTSENEAGNFYQWVLFNVCDFYLHQLDI